MESMLFRKFAALSAALIVFVCASALHAQLGLYATVTGERISGIKCLDAQNICASNDGTVRPYGANFGGYYEFRSLGPARLGLDVRGGVVNSNKPASSYGASTDEVRHYSALGGARASFATPYKFLRPYASVDAGFAHTNAVNTYQNFTQVEAFVGVDVPLFSVIELRAIEFGAGELFGPSSHSTQSIGAGIVFHFH